MNMGTRSTDAKGRNCLPEAFANATVIIEQVSDAEIRTCKAVVIPEDDVRSSEETASPLPDGDRDRSLDLLDHPLAVDEAPRRAAGKHARLAG